MKIFVGRGMREIDCPNFILTRFAVTYEKFLKTWKTNFTAINCPLKFCRHTTIVVIMKVSKEVANTSAYSTVLKCIDSERRAYLIFVPE